ncbi:DNA polymerase/3'-5' exonuclease PolX [Candidatus Bipolaricaulota bacterium]|nr:DNA polymerase/3'-5' exonuclease PolX [Candidatus Bipolaricaulota bacterium]
MDNEEIAKVFNKIADLLDIKGVQFKPRAYRRAAREIESLSRGVVEIYRDGNLENIPAVGENIAEKIAELIETDGLEYLEKLKEEIPIDPGLLKVRNLGPKKAKKIWEELGVTTIDQLEKAISEGKVRELSGFGKKSEKNISKGLKIVERTRGKYLINEVLPVGGTIKGKLLDSNLFDKVRVAGSLRRHKYLIGDIDILGTSLNPNKAMDFYTGLEEVDEVISKGETKSSVRLDNDIRIDLRLVAGDSFGAASQYFTGSQPHNVRLRELAISQGYKLSEYGLFRADNEEKVAGETEESIYEKLGLNWIPPELREDRGEIDAAKMGKLPQLITEGDVNGDLHCHSTRSGDGKNELADLADEAAKRGYSYLAVTDHADAPGVISGIKEGDVEEHIAQIRALNERYDDVHLLAGVEANVQPDGSFRLSDGALEQLDIVVAGVHSHFDMEEEGMTERLLRAIAHREVNIVAHPTGRKVGERDSFSLNWEKVFDKARECNTALEINASPSRFDLDDRLIKGAIDRGVKLSIGTDSHQLRHLDFMQLGIYLARRGWAQESDVINALRYEELISWLEK